jgi:hypothetical protein
VQRDVTPILPRYIGCDCRRSLDKGTEEQTDEHSDYLTARRSVPSAREDYLAHANFRLLVRDRSQLLPARSMTALGSVVAGRA